MRSIIGFTAIAGALLIWAIYAGIQQTRIDREEWRKFIEAQNCKVIARRDAEVITGVGEIISEEGGVAVVSTTTPAQTAWLCDDGVTYWKRREFETRE